jgi:hypothetical protein
VARAGEACVVDLVADPAVLPSPPVMVDLAGRPLRVEARSDCLVDKLCTLLGRAEVRDLIDVQALLAAGESLPAAVEQAPRRDGGFSPLTLAWVLRDVDVAGLARAEGVDEQAVGALAVFRDELIDALLSLAKPNRMAE